MNKHILYLNYILYIYRSNKFIWRKLRADILAAVFLYGFVFIDTLILHFCIMEMCKNSYGLFTFLSAYAILSR